MKREVNLDGGDLIDAIFEGDWKNVLDVLAQIVDVNFVDVEGFTPLHACIEAGGHDRGKLMQLLINEGCNVNAMSLSYGAPLHLAAWRNDLVAIEVLLRNGADPTITTEIDHYSTPEEDARSYGKLEAAELLRDAVARRPKKFEGPFGLADPKEIH